MRRVLGLLILCLAVPLPAAEPGDSGSVVLRAEEDQELCRELKAGEVLHYRFDANRPLAFTAHYHQGSEGRSLWRKDELNRDEGELRAERSARYCLTWFNYQDSALTLRWLVTPGH
jgi:hypothetical protein